MLIFGGTGFLGKHLCAMLHSRGYSGVTVVSRNPDKEFLERFAPSVNCVRLADFLEAPIALEAHSRCIVYLAGNSTPGTFADVPWREFSDNVAPALQLFRQCHSVYPDAKVIFVSSGGTVYGKGHHQPIPEDAPLCPISPYGLGKAAIEHCLEFLGRVEKLKFEILRVSNPVGKWQNSPTQGVVNVMVRAVMNRAPITLFGDGSYIRDFLDADDVANAIIKFCDRETVSNGAWNIGSGVGTSILEVIRIIEGYFNIKAEKLFFPARELDVRYSVLNCNKVNRELGWHANGDVAEMLKKLPVASYA